MQQGLLDTIRVLTAVVAAVTTVIALAYARRYAGRAWRAGSLALLLLSATSIASFLHALRLGGTFDGELAQVALHLSIVVSLLAAVFVMTSQHDEASHVKSELRHQHEMVDQYLDASGALIMGLDTEGMITFANARTCEVLGRPEGDVVGEDWYSIGPPPWAADRRRRFFDEVIRGERERSGVVDGRVIGADGRERAVRWTYSAVTSRGKTLGLMLTGEDMTERITAQEDLELRSFLLDNATDSIIVLGMDGSTLYVNEAAYRTRGYTREEFLALPTLEWLGPEGASMPIAALGDQRDTMVSECKTPRRDGSMIPVEMRTWTVDWHGTPAIVNVLHDLTQQRRAEDAIKHVNFFDPLTGLPNRTHFIEGLDAELEKARETGSPVVVMLLDVDEFKTVNDSLGHTLGDELLLAVGERLRQSVPEGLVGRLGADEFILAFTPVDDESGSKRTASRILGTMREPFDIRGREITSTLSIGIAVSRGSDDTAETMLKEAESAMYSVKDSGRDGFGFFEPIMGETAQERFSLRNELRHAIENDELEVHYQPQVRLASGRIVGAEALLRWHNPRRGPVPVSTLISLAEESALIIPIGEWVLRTACIQNKRWQDMGLSPIRMAVNLSARQLMQVDPLEAIGQALEESGLDPGYLEIEITESMAMHDPEHAAQRFQELRDHGVRIAVDDFGTGYSSLEYLKRLPVNTLKIAQPFVADVTKDRDSAAIVTAISVLGQNMGLNVLAEGVETVEQLDFLLKNGCDEMQGFLYSKAVPADRFTELLRTGRRWRPGQQPVNV